MHIYKGIFIGFLGDHDQRICRDLSITHHNYQLYIVDLVSKCNFNIIFVISQNKNVLLFITLLTKL